MTAALVFLLVAASAQSPTLGLIAGTGAWLAKTLIRAGLDVHAAGDPR